MRPSRPSFSGDRRRSVKHNRNVSWAPAEGVEAGHHRRNTSFAIQPFNGPMGKVVAFGGSKYGQLGLQSNENRPSPTEVEDLQDKGFVSVGCGWAHTVTVTETRAVQTVYSFGWGDHGQLGHGDNHDKNVPTTITALFDVKVAMVACGNNHTAVVTQPGALYTWGNGGYGKLGHGSTETLMEPRCVEYLQSNRIQSVSCGSSHTVAVSASGTVFSFGWGKCGQLGHGDRKDQWLPLAVDGLDEVVASRATCGDSYTIITSDTGQVYAFGRNQYGQLGISTTVDSPVPAFVENLQGRCITQVACGGAHTLFLNYNGDVYAAGFGKYGQLGLGDNTTRTIPAVVEKLRGLNVILLECGYWHSAAVTESGALYTWGNGKSFQLGHIDKSNENIPTQVLALKDLNVGSVACGAVHTIAVLEPPSEKGNVVKERNATVKKTLLDATKRQIERSFGKGAMIRLGGGDPGLHDVSIIPSGSIALDLALGVGGIPRSCITEIYGPRASGKTTLALQLIAEAQKFGGACTYIDTEHSLDVAYASAIGVNTDDLFVAQPDSAEQALQIVDALANSPAMELVVVDSINNLVPHIAPLEENDKDKDKDKDKERSKNDSWKGMSPIEKMMADALNRLSNSLSKSKCAVLFTSRIGGRTLPVPGAQLVKAHAACRVEVRLMAPKTGHKKAFRVYASVVKNKYAPPFKHAEMEYIPGEGLVWPQEIIDTGLRSSVLLSNGKKVSYNKKSLGSDHAKARLYLVQNPKFAADVVAAIKKNSRANTIDLFPEAPVEYIDENMKDPRWTLASQSNKAVFSRVDVESGEYEAMRTAFDARNKAEVKKKAKEQKIQKLEKEIEEMKKSSSVKDKNLEANYMMQHIRNLSEEMKDKKKGHNKTQSDDASAPSAASKRSRFSSIFRKEKIENVLTPVAETEMI